ncbi:regucalcin isoform X1 [Ixodes scapularis]|uniref:regucalcin isoform X1 n=1 Tax=Ixodes scapularis TaxID=6945 RepID=UPI001A9E926E|nr:regucalcin isoform X1 [Ixodes scapularis]
MSVSVCSKRRSELGEGPHWDPSSGTLLHIDAYVHDVCRLDVASQETSTVRLDGIVTFVIPYRSDPNLSVVTVNRQVRKLEWSTGATELLAEVEPDRPNNIFNDGKCDVSGRLWAGTMGRYSDDDLVQESGSLYSFEASNFETRTHVQQLGISNGMTWSLDNETMFFNDSLKRKIYSFRFSAEDGTLSDKQVFLDFATNPMFKECGDPDGMTHDVEGKLWVACWDASRIINIDPETGKLLREVAFPVSRPTSCCFGGPNYDVLYVTSAWRGLSATQRECQPLAGAVFQVANLGTRGLPANTFNR